MADSENKVITSPDTLMLGFLCVKDLKTLSEKVEILDRFGIKDSDIALICKCAQQSVRDACQKAKKKPTK